MKKNIENIKKETIELFEIYKKQLINKPLDEIYTDLCDFLEKGMGFTVPFKLQDLKSERDLLECVIESYSLTYCIVNGLDYKKFDVSEYLEKDEFLNWLATYKVEHFGAEILAELGFQIVKKEKNGSILIRDVNNKIIN